MQAQWRGASLTHLAFAVKPCARKAFCQVLFWVCTVKCFLGTYGNEASSMFRGQRRSWAWRKQLAAVVVNHVIGVLSNPNLSVPSQFVGKLLEGFEVRKCSDVDLGTGHRGC